MRHLSPKESATQWLHATLARLALNSNPKVALLPWVTSGLPLVVYRVSTRAFSNRPTERAGDSNSTTSVINVPSATDSNRGWCRHRRNGPFPGEPQTSERGSGTPMSVSGQSDPAACPMSSLG